MSDILSDVLRAVRLTGSVFFSVEATAPWVAESPPALVMAPLIRPGIEHVIQFHAIASGSCWGGLLDEPSVALHAGDVLLLPQGDRHVMSSHAGMRGDPVQVNLDPNCRQRLPLPVRLGGGEGEPVKIICGFLGCDSQPFNPLLATLPRKLHMRRADQKDDVIAQLIAFALTESGSPSAGRECFLARLAELLFVEVMRRYVASLPSEKTGWLAGISDDLVGRALSTLHERPAHAWTLEDLASDVASSRSVLAERFAELVGMPPIQYLTQWRMQLAAEVLRTTNASLAEIAGRVGYGSETALSRAFKRIVGVSPVQFRHGEKDAAPVTEADESHV